MCGREPFSICEIYDWLMVLPISLRMPRTSSSCVIGRPKPRSEPSTSRRYRIFSATLITQIAIFILQFEINVKNWICRVFKRLQGGAVLAAHSPRPSDIGRDRLGQGACGPPLARSMTFRFGRRKATSTAQTGAGGSLNFTQPISESDPTSQLKTNDFRGITLR